MKVIRAFIILLLIPLSAFAAERTWQVFKSTHFLIFYNSANDSQLNELAQRAEKYYNTITDDLGFTRFNFWTWDNRARIYLFDDQQEYMQNTGDPHWAAGQAQIGSKTISTYIINSETGMLTSIATTPALDNPQLSVSVEPSGKFMYSAEGASNGIRGFSISQVTGIPSTGALTPAGQYPCFMVTTGGILSNVPLIITPIEPPVFTPLK